MPPSARPDHFQDVTTNVCLQSSPASWVKFGCDAENVTQTYYAAKGCAGAPSSVTPVLPLGCSPTAQDPAHPDARAGAQVAVCGKKQPAAAEAAQAAVAAVLPLGAPQPLAEARAAVAAVTAEIARAAAEAVAAVARS